MGTVDFIAPEQANDSKKADHHADIYSLGCTLYFLLAGRPPFDGETILKRLMAHQQQPAPSLHAVRDDVPAALEAAYQTMMAKRPTDRPRSMAEVIELLENCRATRRRGQAGPGPASGSFAETVMKRASPRKRDRSPDASVFARRTEKIGPEVQPRPEPRGPRPGLPRGGPRRPAHRGPAPAADTPARLAPQADPPTGPPGACWGWSRRRSSSWSATSGSPEVCPVRRRRSPARRWCPSRPRPADSSRSSMAGT